MEKIFIQGDLTCLACCKPLAVRKTFKLPNEDGLCELVLKTSHVVCRKRIERRHKLQAEINKHKDYLTKKEQELLNLEFLMFSEKFHDNEST